jgi:hypothetical protein
VREQLVQLWDLQDAVHHVTVVQVLCIRFGRAASLLQPLGVGAIRHVCGCLILQEHKVGKLIPVDRAIRICIDLHEKVR